MSHPHAIIQSLWIGNNLSTMEKLCIFSYVKHGYQFELYTYQDIKNVPDGVILRDAEKILPANKIFKYRNFDSYAGFANLFRYKLLLEKGNYWSDMDVVCLSSQMFKNDFVFVAQNTNYGNSVVNNSFIKCPSNSNVMKYAYEEANKKNPEELMWGETGPLLLDEAISKFNLKACMMNHWLHSPIDYWNIDEIVKNRTVIDLIKIRLWFLFKGTRSVHLWNEMWRRKNLDKNAKYPYYSLYEHFKRCYLTGI